MALDEGILTNLMLVTFGFLNPGAEDEWAAVAEGTIAGLKLGTVTGITTGASGSPGQGTGIGALQGGPLVMVPIVATNALGVVPPIPEGTPTPLQPLWYLAVSQIATHVLTALQVEFAPTDPVATGVVTVAPGGFQIQGDVVANFILLAYISKGLIITPKREDTAKAIGQSVQQMMSTATMLGSIVGGVPVAPPAPGAGTRVGVIS